MIDAHKYGNNFTNRPFLLLEEVVFICILSNFRAKIGSHSLATKFIKFTVEKIFISHVFCTIMYPKSANCISCTSIPVIQRKLLVSIQLLAINITAINLQV